MQLVTGRCLFIGALLIGGCATAPTRIDAPSVAAAMGGATGLEISGDEVRISVKAERFNLAGRSPAEYAVDTNDKAREFLAQSLRARVPPRQHETNAQQPRGAVAMADGATPAKMYVDIKVEQPQYPFDLLRSADVWLTTAVEGAAPVRTGPVHGGIGQLLPISGYYGATLLFIVGAATMVALPLTLVSMSSEGQSIPQGDLPIFGAIGAAGLVALVGGAAGMFGLEAMARAGESQELSNLVQRALDEHAPAVERVLPATPVAPAAESTSEPASVPPAESIPVPESNAATTPAS